MLFIYFLLYIWEFFKRLLGFSHKKFEKEKLLKELYEQLEHVKTYEEFYDINMKIDELTGVNEWKNKKESSLYDYAGIEKKLNILKSLLESNNVHELKSYLRSSLIRNIGGIGNVKLYTKSKIGTKKLIEDYVNSVVKALEYICENEFDDFPPEEKFEFFYETRQAFGRSALCLSGGATLGMYHLGVIKVLFEHNLLPRVISGSSVGSIIASVLAIKLDSELPVLFQQNGINFNAFDSKGSARRKIKRLLTEGVLMDIKKLQQCIRDNIGDVTFKESYDRTKRILNITVASTNSHEMPRLLNYLTSPNVLIWSAAAASCALAFLYKPVELMVKDENGEIKPYSTSGLLWSDGSVESDLPMTRLSELFNVNHFLVSQVNPHVIPFLSITENNRLGIFGKLIVDEFRMRLKQLSSYFLRGNRFLRQLAVVINQKYSGDITIYPDITIEDYKKLLSNPIPEWMSECQYKSEKKTWQYLNYIKHHCAIELTLDRCMRKMAKRVQSTDKKKLLSVYKKVHK